MVTSLKDLQVSLGVAGPSEQSLQENFVLSLVLDESHDASCLCLRLQQCLELLECFQVGGRCVLLLTGDGTARLVGLQYSWAYELVIQEGKLLQQQTQ